MYLIASNRTEQADGVANLQRTFLVYRAWAREQMELYGFGPNMTFNVETEADGWTPKVYVVQSDKDDSYLAADMWNRCGAAADAATGGQFWDANNLWFVVGEAHIMQPDGSLVGHYVGGTGNAQAGVAVVSGDCLAMSDPQYLTNNVDYDGLTIPEIGPYAMVYGTTFGTGEGSTLSSVGSTYNGADMHEFGHCFHLHHDFRNDWNFFGNDMGNGFRGMRGYIYPARYPSNFVRTSYAFALQRSVNRFFNPDETVLDITTPTISAVPTGVVSVVDGKAVLNFSVSDASGLGLALVIDMNSGFGSGVLAEQRLSGASTNFTIRTPYYRTTAAVTNQLRVQDIFGNESSQTFVYSVAGVTNRCPWSNIKIMPPLPAVGQSVTFDATESSDPDDALGTVTVEWDFNNDNVYDTPPLACTSTYTTNFSAPSLRQVKVRLNDSHGGIWVSSPVGMRVGSVTHYVWTNSPQPEAPYDSWVKAAHTIPEAVGTAVDGDLVLVAPGVYDTGGTVTPGGALTNRVCITNAITVRSDAGPDQTIIVGASDGGGFGPAAVRCAFVGSNAVLSGFTLTNGWTRNAGDARRDQSGGGALVIGGSVSNCNLLGNSANVYGGGAAVYYGGLLANSTLADNWATRGGAVDFEYGGAASSLVQWCEIRNNQARDYGGGVYCRGVGLVANCTIYSNMAGRYGGGVHLAYTSRVENCAIYGNSVTDTVTYGLGGGVMSEFNGPEVRSCTVADNSAGREGGGVCIKDGTGTVVNSIFYFNTAPAGANWQTNSAGGSRVTYSCTTPTNGLPSGLACVDGAPLFENEAARDYRLTRYSPALDAGLNSAWASNVLDVAANPRITGTAIDMGAYENPSLFTPAVTTDPVTNITTTGAECGGVIDDEGSYPVTARGVCWSTSTNPTIADSHTTDGAGAGHFASVITNLSPGTLYHVRAYASNTVGASYGEDRSFSATALLSDIGAGLAGVYYSAGAWGDVDNDGDLDILLSGYTGSAALTRLYRNDGVAGFTNAACGLPNCYYSSLALGDYDRDGDLDVLISGTSTYMTRLYNNDGTGTFVNTGANFPGLYIGSAAWGDYDNDGDLDLLLSGQSTNSTDGYRFTKVYRNDNGSFAAIEAGLPAVYQSSVAWGDYDRDGDMDVLISGDSTGGMITRVYANHGDGVFSNINAGLVGIDLGKAAWGDYDNDGYPDILLSGNATTRVYHNNGNGTFTDISAGLQGLSSAAVAWGDYDVDGDMDALVFGYSGTRQTRLYRNDGGTFSLVSDANLAAVYNGDAAWGDYDNDGRLDLLLAGSSSGGAVAYVYRNQNGVSNTPPSMPSGLTVVTNGPAMTLSWSEASDGQTAAAGLTYNLRVGTTPGGEGAMSGMADTTNGWRRVPAMGNAGHNTSWSLSDLQSGTSYYWSVQAVDAAFAGGTWAAEGSFVMPRRPSVTTDPVSNITATSAESGGEVTDQGDSPVTARGCVWSTDANPTVTHCEGITTNGSGLGAFGSSLTGMVPATLTYHVRAYAINEYGAGYGEERTFSTLTTPPGNALDFDGINDHVFVSDAADLNMTNNFTLECWFRPDGFGTLRGLISKYQTAAANGYYLRLTTNNLDFDQLTTSNLNLQAGRWYHVAAVNSNGAHRLYLNGVERTLYGTVLNVSSNSNALRLGSDFSGRYFNGRLDEARIWSVARTEDEIRDAMHRELKGDETNLVAYYAFNHLEGTTLQDGTDRGHDGTLTNGPVWVISTIPCAEVITNRTNLRAVWSAQTNSLASSRLSLTEGVIAGDENVVFGHDDGTDDWIVSDLPSDMKRRLGRVWQTELAGTNTVAAFTMDIAGLDAPDASQVRLLADANGVFADGATLVTGTLNGTVFTVTNQALTGGIFYTVGEAANLPIVTTAPISNVTHHTASGGGEVTFVGSGSVTARGVCWSTSTNPTIADSHTTDGSGIGAFTSEITGLATAMLYHVRAYAVNDSGAAYGEERSFTTGTAPPGDALDFDGTNDYVGIPHAQIGNPSSNFTIECWAMRDTVGSGYPNLLSKHKNEGGSSRSGYALEYAYPLNRIQAVLGSTSGWTTVSGGSWNPDEWHHVALVYDAASTMLSLYDNGILQASLPRPQPLYNTNDLYLGASQHYGNYFDGRLDEVRIWTVVRSEDQIRDNMHKVLSGTESGLLAYYRFDDGSGATLSDRTVNDIDGVLSNGPVWVASSFPCAVGIDGRANLRGAWIAQSNSLVSSILSISNSMVTGIDFRVFGHDGAMTTNTSDRPDFCAWRLDRAWQVEGAGTLTGDFTFDCAGITNLIGNSARLRLLVDGDGSFANAASVAGTYADDFFVIDGQSVPTGGYYTIGEQAVRTIVADAGLHGSITPSGAVTVVHGEATNFVIAGDTYWHVADVTTNGASIGTVTAFTWSNVTVDGTIHADFAADLAAQGTPHWWLALFGLTNSGASFDEAETSDTDADSFYADAEYIADTNPTNAASFLHVTNVAHASPVEVQFVSSTGRMYSMHGASNLVDEGWTFVPGTGPRMGAGDTDSMQDTNNPPLGPYYRLEVEMP